MKPTRAPVRAVFMAFERWGVNFAPFQRMGTSWMETAAFGEIRRRGHLALNGREALAHMLELRQRIEQAPRVRMPPRRK